MNKGGLERRRVSASRSSTMRSPVLAGFSGGFSFVRPMLEEILFPFQSPPEAQLYKLDCRFRLTCLRVVQFWPRMSLMLTESFSIAGTFSRLA